MRYRDLVRITRRELKSCAKREAPEWLKGYAKESMAKADFFHVRRRSSSCAVRSRAMNELLQLGDMLRYWRQWS